MQALTLGRGRLQLADVPVPDRPGEGLVRVTMAGICGTDLELVRGYADLPGIPGHEFVGVVEAVSKPEDRHWIGQRVVGDINIGCGACLTGHVFVFTVWARRGRPASDSGGYVNSRAAGERKPL